MFLVNLRKKSFGNGFLQNIKGFILGIYQTAYNRRFSSSWRVYHSSIESYVYKFLAGSASISPLYHEMMYESVWTTKKN